MGRINLHLWGFVFLSVVLFASSSMGDIEEGLVGHWKLDDGEDDPGSTIATDSVGGHHGTLFNGPAWTDSVLEHGGALSFDGGDDFVEIPHSDDFTFSAPDSYTVAAWVNVTSLPGQWTGIVTKSRDTNADDWYGLWINPSNQWHFAGGGDGSRRVEYGTVTTGWHHLAGVYDADAATLKIYEDGDLLGQNSGTIVTIGAGDLWIGGAKSVNEYLDGVVDDVRIYNRALSDEEITELTEWTGASVSAGPDQRVEGGTLTTLTGSGPPDATSFAWEQIITGDEPAVSLSNPNSTTTTFTPPAREIGYILTFRLTVVSPTFGTTSDECLVFVTAPNEPRIAPSNFRTYPSDLGYRLQWDPLVDAEEYGVGFKVGQGMYFWFWTSETFYNLTNLTEGQPTVIAVMARNKYGEGVASDDITLIPMRNYALPSTLGGTNPPSDYVYVISHFALTDMNDTEVENDNNDSYDGLYKAEDYWGYLWPGPIYVDHVTYFTGDMFGDGGWFTSLKLQYTQDGVTWLDVPAQIVPPYEFADQRSGRRTYERFDFFIPTLRGTGIRIYGTPGGSATFTTIAELEVFADMATLRPIIVQGKDAEFPERGTATLDGSFSFSTRGPITSYLWEQVSGPSVTITNATSAIATFEAPGVDEDTVLIFRLTAGDGTETLSDEDVRITVKNLVTTAVAGADQGVKEGATATLDGSGSTTTTGDITYQWTQTSGDPVTLDNPNAAIADFDAPAAIWDYTRKLTFRLDVDDGNSGTSSDEVTVEIQNSLAYPAWPYTDAAAPTTGYMTEMLHLGDNPTDRILGPLNINSDPLANFGGQAFVNPVPGDVYDFSDSGVTTTRPLMAWTPIHADDGFFGDEGVDNFEQVYHVYVISPDERPARFHIRHDDEVRIWNNGLLAVSRDGWDNGVEVTNDTTLNEGLNSITIKFEDGTGGNYVALGITDEFDSLMSDVYYALGPSFVLADAYAVRELPHSYQAGGSVEVTLSSRINPDDKPSGVTISEPIPAGLTVVDAGGGTQVGSSLNWSFSGTSVATQVLTYTLGVPAGTSGGVDFTGTVAFSGTTDAIKGDKVVYEVPSAPQNLDTETLLATNLSWSVSPEEGVVGYRVYRNVNGQGWEEIAFVSTNSYKDSSIVEGNTYDYQVAAVNAGGVQGPPSQPSGEKMITMLVREAEDFNYGGGSYPGFQNCPVAVESTASDDLTFGMDYFFLSTTFPDRPNVYRPDDDIDIREINPGQHIIGYTTVGDWWRYTFDVPAPGPNDPAGGWVKIVLKVASPGGGVMDLYWDEVLVGSVNFVTGSWGTYDTFPMEEQFQTTTGVHTLRVHFASGELDFDTIGIGFNWTKPTREDIFADDFEDYTTLYSFADLVSAGYMVNNGSGVADGAWRLWNTAGNNLGNENPALDAMTNNYAITDSDLSGAVDVDEELITPALDCTEHKRVRLDFNKNYRVYADDVDHPQTADVDIRSSDDGVTWGDWVTLLWWDTSTVSDYTAGPEQVDLSAHADGKFIQVRWRYYEANYDYWFAIDDVRVSGDKENGGIPLPPGPPLYANGIAEVSWQDFGGGNYTVQYTNDLTSGNWQPVPDATWPITATTWSGDITGIFSQSVYLRIRSD